MNIKSVAFFGSSTSKKNSSNFQAAREVAAVVAQTGRRIVNGGGMGVMLASTLGARDMGGKVTVVYYKPELATKFEGKNPLNFADKSYQESNYVLRTKKLLELADAYIVFKGGTGTISEFAMAWGVARLYFGHNKPLILYGKFWRPIIKNIIDCMEIRPEEKKVYKIATSPKQVMNHIDHYQKVIKSVKHKHGKKGRREANLYV